MEEPLSVEQRSDAIDLQAIVVRDASLHTAEVDDDLIVLNIATGRYVGLDNIGREIWEAIAAPMIVRDLCEALGRRYHTDPDRIRTDVLGFLQELAEQSLIRVQS